MFTVRRIFRSRKPLTNYIYTSKVLKSDEFKESNNEEKEKSKNEKKGKEGSVSKEKMKRSKEKKMTHPSTDPSQKISKSSENKERASINVETTMPSKDKTSQDFKVPTTKGLFRKIVLSSVNEVAKELGGDKQQIKADLLEYIKTIQVSKEDSVESSAEEEEDHKVESSSADLLFADMRDLRIFPAHWKVTEVKESTTLNIWDSLEEEELERLCKRPPNNYFEELIKWTDEGRLWLFPIDNDQGLEKEANISFTEHIFLEQYLEPWCPKKGPLRRFMELVLIGLSKNHHLSVEEKKEHIAWFEKYFENKKKLLQELGAMGGAKQIQVPDPEQSSSSS